MTFAEWWEEFKREHDPVLDELSEYCAKATWKYLREYYLTPEGMMELQAEYQGRIKAKRANQAEV